MHRTKWRVSFHLGRYAVVTATESGARKSIHKTRISPAFAALGQKRS
jgi:hypothetical protein